MILLNKKENIVNVYLHLPYKLSLKYKVIIYVLLVAGLAAAPFLLKVKIIALVILQLPVCEHLLSLKLVKGGKYVDGFEKTSKQGHEPSLRIFAHNGLPFRELILQLLDKLLISIAVLPFLRVVSVIIRQEVFQHHDAACILVPEQGNGIISSLLKIPETDYVAEGLDRVQYPVRSGKCLYQSVLFQVLVHKQGIECGGIKARKEHIHHYQQVHLPVLHPQRQVFIVVLELVAGCVIIRGEHPVVILYGSFKEIP